MGDPRKTRKKYQKPGHPWVASRIEEEREIRKQFGTKNKREIYKMNTALKRFKNQAKSLVSRTDAQAAIERDQMTSRMVRLGLVKSGASLDDILSLSITDLMNRRLQTLLVKRLLARSTNQARQLIVHGHVMVGDNVVTSPSYLVRVAEEASISFRANSPFVSDQHPERFSEEELKKQNERAAAKSMSKESTSEEEAPPAYKEEDLEDPEEATTVKKTAETKPPATSPEPTSPEKQTAESEPASEASSETEKATEPAEEPAVEPAASEKKQADETKKEEKK